MPVDVSVYIRYLYHDGGIRGKKLLEMFPDYSKRTIYHHIHLPVGEITVDRRHFNKGRPKILTDRDGRNIIRQVNILRETTGIFSSRHIQQKAGISERRVSNRTFRRYLNKRKYRYLQCRKKGQMTRADTKKRLQFARKVRMRLPKNFWTDGISFYLDGVSWAHKTNPCKQARTYRTRTWRKPGEGLSINCTGKGKKEGTGGKVAKFIVAIAYGKGVIKCHQYTGSISGELFAEFIKARFPQMFERSANPKGHLFLQDGDPSQNSAKAKLAMDSIGCKLFKIPARSPDLNPIENIFHLVGKKIRQDALDQNIQHENFEEFSKRVKNTIKKFPIKLINKTIRSMNKRIDLVIKCRGERTKY